MGEQSTILRLGRLAIEHWRTIVLLPILALGTYLIIQGNSLALVALALLLIIIASQLFWIARIIDLGELLIPGRPRRASLHRVGYCSHGPSIRLPAAEHTDPRGILVVVRGVDVGVSINHCIRDS
jgi:hypothetical protein